MKHKTQTQNILDEFIEEPEEIENFVSELNGYPYYVFKSLFQKAKGNDEATLNLCIAVLNEDYNALTQYVKCNYDYERLLAELAKEREE